MLNCPLCGTDADDVATKCGCGFVFRSSGPIGGLPSNLQSSPHYRPGEPPQTSAVAKPASPASSDTGGSELSITGALSIILGLLVMIYGGALFDPTVQGESLYGIASRSYNIGLQQTQMLLFLTGAILFLAGIMLFVAGAIVKAIRTGSR